MIINGRRISKNDPPYIIAELSANHNGDIEQALRTIRKAKEVGADAIKLQTYTPATMTLDSDKSDFMIEGGPWGGYRLYDLYKEAHTPYEWHQELFEEAKKLDITCFSTPFDESAVDLLEDLNVPAYKIASFELTDLPLIKLVASKNKPMIMSTGMATLEEIHEAVKVAHQSGADSIALLHCISSYPAPASQSNLRMLSTIEKEFDTVVGLSDHTLGTKISTMSVALGASVIEKHFILDRHIGGPDSSFSIEPSELKELCEDCFVAWEALGKGDSFIQKAEVQSLRFRRSLYITEDVKKGDILSVNNLRRVRPSFGLAPKYYEQVLGRKVNQDIERNTALKWDHLDS